MKILSDKKYEELKGDIGKLREAIRLLNRSSYIAVRHKTYVSWPPDFTKFSVDDAIVAILEYLNLELVHIPATSGTVQLREKKNE